MKSAQFRDTRTRKGGPSYLEPTAVADGLGELAQEVAGETELLQLGESTDFGGQGLQPVVAGVEHPQVGQVALLVVLRHIANQPST